GDQPRIVQGQGGKSPCADGSEAVVQLRIMFLHPLQSPERSVRNEGQDKQGGEQHLPPGRDAQQAKVNLQLAHDDMGDLIHIPRHQVGKGPADVGGLVVKQQIHSDQKSRPQKEENQGDPIPFFFLIPAEKPKISGAKTDGGGQGSSRIGPPEGSRKKEDQRQKEKGHRQPAPALPALQPGGTGQNGRTENDSHTLVADSDTAGSLARNDTAQGISTK